MTFSYIRAYRAINQQLFDTQCKTPQQVVEWLGAMQAQEYAMAKWAIALRLENGFKEADIESAFNNGEILRTHLLRPTWHFVSPKDIRWMLQLTSPRVHAVNAFMYRQTGLDSKIFKKANDIFIKKLEGNKHLTRDELSKALAKKKIAADGHKLGYIMMQAELDGVICSGARQGKQHTYALLEERAPGVKPLTRDEALATMTERYFTSRGPATVKDFTWWSGLTVKEAKAGIAMLSKDFTTAVINDEEYIFRPSGIKPAKKHQLTFLMPDYDEYGIAYKDRSAISHKDIKIPKGLVFNRIFVIDGMGAGTWKPIVKSKTTDVEITLFRELNRTGQLALDKAIKRYKEFIGN